jgi:DNA-binding NarL/FixJ family response regulator
MFILLVDDNQFYVSVMKEMLLQAGFNHIGSVESGFECVFQIYKGDVPDVIIIDENQCFINGVDVISKISESIPNLTVIVLADKDAPVNFNLLPKKGSTLYFIKENITAENLPQALYTIFTESISFPKKVKTPNTFSLYKKSLAGILN